ncbi:MAG: hypothetical protein GVX96_02460, partial [Bacteroidetes bacterium]|nr:hypothetical protein [Bacteroidota bacterium]
GFMGNSGSSVGPHLHFEVRHTESEAPLNPLRWFSDYIHGDRPFAGKLKIYQVGERGNVLAEYAYRLRRIGGDFVLANGRIELPEGRYGWAVQAIQPFNQWRNKNGLYALESSVDGNLLYAVCMDSLPFDLNRYINAHIDYPLYCKGKQRLHSLFARPHQETSCVRYDQDRGLFLLSDSSSHQVRIHLSDIEGQSAEVRFRLKAKKDNSPNEVVDSKEGQVDPFSTFSYSDDYVRFHARPKTFYSQHPLEISTVCEKGPAGLLPTAYVDTDCHPFHKSAELRFLDLPYRPDSVREKWYLGHRQDGNWVDIGGYWEGNDFVAQVRKEGQYRICLAGPPPELVTRSRAFRSGRQASFRVQAGTPSQFRVKDIDIRVTYGGKFLPYSYDKKGSRLSLTLPEDGGAKDSLRIKLADRWGQSRAYSFPVLD